MTHNPSVYSHLSIRASQDASSRYWTSVFLNMFIPRHFAVTKTGGFGLDQKTSGVFIMSIHMIFSPKWRVVGTWYSRLDHCVEQNLSEIFNWSVYIVSFLVNCGTTIYTINPQMCRLERFHASYISLNRGTSKMCYSLKHLRLNMILPALSHVLVGQGKNVSSVVGVNENLTPTAGPKRTSKVTTNKFLYTDHYRLHHD